jgi:hypothetical protein
MLDPSDAATQRSKARVGHVLRDKWQIDRLIGIGGMAAVYAATHVKNGRKVALKVLHPEASMSKDTRARFLREGYAANKLEHPGTVQVLDDDVAEDGSAFLVMELLLGESLEDRRERLGGRLPALELLRIAERVLDVLAVAHEKGVVHRDLKPDNVFLCDDGAVKLLDFGIARVREPAQKHQTLTSAGAMGTPGYMPPEQARGRWDDVGPRSDLWALGATLFTGLTGRLVHHAETPNELLLAAMTQQAPKLASLVPSIAPEIAALVDRALAREPEARWPDARAMLAALQTALAQLSEPAAGRGSMPSVTERPPPAAFTPAMPFAAPASPTHPGFAHAGAAQTGVAQAALPPAAPVYSPGQQPVPPAYVVPRSVGVSAHGPGNPALSVSAPRPFLGPGSPGLATGHPVTVSHELPGASGSRAAAPRLALLFGAVLAGGVVMGALLYLVLGRTPPPASDPHAASTEPVALVPSVGASAAPAPSESASATSAGDESALAPLPSATPSSAPTAAAQASASSSAHAPAAPKKPGSKPPSVQDLLNRRR